MKQLTKNQLLPMKKLKANTLYLRPYVHINPLVRMLFWKQLETMFDMAKPKKVALDFGSGFGVFLPALSEKFKKVVAIDLNTIPLEYIKKMLKLDNVHIIKGKKNKIPFMDNTFDCIFAGSVLEHCDDVCIFRELHRVLKKGGLLVVSCPSENFLYKAGRKFLYYNNIREEHFFEVEFIFNKCMEFFKLEEEKFIPFGMPIFYVFSCSKVGKSQPKRQKMKETKTFKCNVCKTGDVKYVFTDDDGIKIFICDTCNMNFYDERDL